MQMRVTFRLANDKTQHTQNSSDVIMSNFFCRFQKAKKPNSCWLISSKNDHCGYRNNDKTKTTNGSFKGCNCNILKCKQRAHNIQSGLDAIMMMAKETNVGKLQSSVKTLWWPSKILTSLLSGEYIGFNSFKRKPKTPICTEPRCIVIYIPFTIKTLMYRFLVFFTDWAMRVELKISTNLLRYLTYYFHGGKK